MTREEYCKTLKGYKEEFQIKVDSLREQYKSENPPLYKKGEYVKFRYYNALKIGVITSTHASLEDQGKYKYTICAVKKNGEIRRDWHPFSISETEILEKLSH